MLIIIPDISWASPRTYHRNNRRIGAIYWVGWLPTGLTDVYTPRMEWATYHMYKLGANIGDRWRVHAGAGTTKVKTMPHPRSLGVWFMGKGWNFTPFIGIEMWQIKVDGSKSGDSFLSIGAGFEYTARWGWNLGMGAYAIRAAPGFFFQAAFFVCTAWASVKCKSSIFF